MLVSPKNHEQLGERNSSSEKLSPLTSSLPFSSYYPAESESAIRACHSLSLITNRVGGEIGAHFNTILLMGIPRLFEIAGYSSAALMAIIVAIPFAVRVLFHNEVGPWSNLYQAFFHTYLELYLGNSCLGE